MLLGVGIWGFQMGITMNIIAAKISDTTNKEFRGTAFGVYYITVGFIIFITNSISGFITKHISLEMVFWFSSIFASLSLIMIPLLKKRKL